MKNIFFNLSAIIVILCYCSCNEPILNDHYHLQWSSNSSQFQTWNIKNNTMRINSWDHDNPKEGLLSHISFDGDVMSFLWVHTICDYKYTINDKGTITLIDNPNDPMKLVPYHNCISNTEYFYDKTQGVLDDFAPVEYSSLTGKAVFPYKYKNEMIIGISQDLLYCIFNDKLLKTGGTIDNLITKIPGSPEVWVHIDKHVTLKQFLPFVQELFLKEYEVSFSSIEANENDEQVNLISRNIKYFQKTGNSQFEIEYDDHCDKYPNEIIDSIISIEMIGKDLYVLNNDTTDLFQIRNAIIRFVSQNRTTRLNSEIQFKIPNSISYGEYFFLIDDLKFAHDELTGNKYYYGYNDKDQEEILKNQNDNLYDEVLNEFPMRIREFIIEAH